MLSGLQCGRHWVELSAPCVMGVLNVTPDSFSDGGKFQQLNLAIAHAEAMVEAGAAIIDVGGESTRPGAAAVSEAEEIDRVIPVLEMLNKHFEVALSIDTSKPGVMRAAVKAGAGMVNDVRALQEPDALRVVADSGVPVCLMHMQGQPRTMQAQPIYQDVVKEVIEFLQDRLGACLGAGILRKNIVLDPGFGFGKTLKHNQQLLKHLDRLVAMGFPVLAGMSQKSMIGQMLGGVDTDQRKYGSLAAAVIAAWQGAAILRVHDVRATVDALKIVNAVKVIE